MNHTVLDELKTQANILLKSKPEISKLKDGLNEAAVHHGFSSWKHCTEVFSSKSSDQGTFWYRPGCSAFFCQWFANLDEARRIHRQSKGFLLPYKNQFVVVENGFIELLGLSAADPRWIEIGHDLAGNISSKISLCFASLVARKFSAIR